VSTGDAIALLAITVLWLIYEIQALASSRRDVVGARAVLVGVKHGMVEGWGELFFSTEWTAENAKRRAQADFDSIQKRTFGQVFLVPTQPIASLLASPAAGDLIRSETIEAANIALYRIGAFNQLVQKQTDFNARHLPDIVDEQLPAPRRKALAHAAYKISYMLHVDGVGTANAAGGWYRKFKDAVESNITALDASPWWNRIALDLAIVVVIAAAALVAWKLTDNPPERPRLPNWTHTHSPALGARPRNRPAARHLSVAKSRVASP
jgi:hypothetical protein